MSEFDEDTTEELKRGEELAEKLVTHLLNMNAASAAFPVRLEVWKEPEWVVIVRPLKPGEKICL